MYVQVIQWNLMNTNLLEWWQLVTYHVTNQHCWDRGHTFTKCEHEELSEEDTDCWRRNSASDRGHELQNYGERRLQKDPRSDEGRKSAVEVFYTDRHQGMQKMITCTLVACVIIQEPQWHFLEGTNRFRSNVHVQGICMLRRQH